jgi:hypothetical protein
MLRRTIVVLPIKKMAINLRTATPQRLLKKQDVDQLNNSKYPLLIAIATIIRQ